MQAGRVAQTARFCRELYHAGLQERRDAWRLHQVSVNRIAHTAELLGVNEVRREGALIHSQVVQEVLMRLDRTFTACFKRVHNGQKPG